MQDARGIGGELDAGAGFLEPLRLFEHDGAEALARERQRRGQPADAGACDKDGARCRHGDPPAGRSGGRVRSARIGRPRRVRIERGSKR